MAWPGWKYAVITFKRILTSPHVALLLIAATSLPAPTLLAQDEPAPSFESAGEEAADVNEVRAWLDLQRANAEDARLYRLSAEQGDADAQLQLGRTLVSGVGVPPDPAEGVRWIRLAAEQGHADAQNALGVAYHLGRGVRKDETEAARWRRRAAEQGHTLAQIVLAGMYLEGRGVIKDVLEAERWYLRAAENGNTSAQMLLAEMYIDGHGAIKDVVEGASWYRQLAESGDSVAQFRLGLIYQGDDILEDFVLAHMWFNVASAIGFDTAGTLRDQIELSMTREEILRATELAPTVFASEYKTCGR